MLEKYMIRESGFRNVFENGQVTGFRVNVIIAYYRGVYLRFVENFVVKVDGETFARDKIRFTVRDHSYALDDLAKVTDVRWNFGEPATLTISKPGGLAPGMHEVEVAETIRISYLPMPNVTTTGKKKMTLVA
jgi:hypothetical protein